ncbi:MAG: hypothetical protein ABIE36_02115 [Candidatus Diapherotrites archaeon]
MESKEAKMAEKKYVEKELSRLIEFTIQLEDELNSCIKCEQ